VPWSALGEGGKVGHGQSGEGGQMLLSPGEQIRLFVDRKKDVVVVLSQKRLNELQICHRVAP